MTTFPVNRTDWERAVVARATHFVVARPLPHAGRARRQWDQHTHLTLAAAVADAGIEPRTLIYAVASDMESFPISRKDREEFLAIERERQI